MSDDVASRAPAAPPPEPTSTTAWTGQVVAGRYRILRPLGEGSMGAVFQAQHVRMGKCQFRKFCPHPFRKFWPVRTGTWGISVRQ